MLVAYLYFNNWSSNNNYQKGASKNVEEEKVNYRLLLSITIGIFGYFQQGALTNLRFFSFSQPGTI